MDRDVVHPRLGSCLFCSHRFRICSAAGAPLIPIVGVPGPYKRFIVHHDYVVAVGESEMSGSTVEPSVQIGTLISIKPVDVTRRCGDGSFWFPIDKFYYVEYRDMNRKLGRFVTWEIWIHDDPTGEYDKRGPGTSTTIARAQTMQNVASAASLERSLSLWRVRAQIELPQGATQHLEARTEQ